MRLRRLKINRLYDVKPGCELYFHEGTNILLGKSGSGKTTLLNLISMVLRFDFSSLGKEELDIEFDMDLQVPSVPCSLRAAIAFKRQEDKALEPGAAGGPPPLVPNIFFQLALGKEVLIYRLNRTVLRVERTGRVVVERTVAYATHTDAPFLLLYSILETSRGLSAIVDVDELASSFQSILYRFSRTHRLDEGLDLFAGVIGVRGNQLASRALPAEAIVRVMPGTSPLAPEKASLRNHEVLRKHPSMVFSFVPLDLWRAAWKHAAANPLAEALCITDAELPWLRKAVLLIGHASAEVHLSLTERKGEGESEEVTFGKLAFVFTTDSAREEDRKQLTHAQLSYGQKRLLALFYYLAANPGHIVADELTSGLDPAWIPPVREEVQRRQAFLATQSLLPFESLGGGSPADTGGTNIICEIDDEDQQMVWRNMNDDEPEPFESSTLVN